MVNTVDTVAIYGAWELVSQILVMSTMLVAVFVPIGFIGGLTGSLFTEVAFTLVATVVISMIVALTLTRCSVPES